MVECRHEEKQKPGRESNTEETELRRGHQGAGRAPEVDSTDEEANVEQVLGKPDGGRVMESGMIYNTPGRRTCGGFNRHRRQPSKQII